MSKFGADLGRLVTKAKKEMGGDAEASAEVVERLVVALAIEMAAVTGGDIKTLNDLTEGVISYLTQETTNYASIFRTREAYHD